MRTGRRCTTLIQLPVAFCAGSSANGLFASAAEIDLRIPDFASVPRHALGAALVTHFLSRWEDDDVLKALLRTAATHAAAAERLRTIFQRQIRPAIAPVCADAASASRRAALVASQMLGFGFCRYVIALPPIAGMPRAEIVDWLEPTIQR
jgi:hypothetical protein